MESALIRFDEARRAIDIAQSVDEVNDIRVKAKTMLSYAKEIRDLDLEAEAKGIELRAKRRLGEMLAEQDLHRGGRPSKTAPSLDAVSLPEVLDMPRTSAHRLSSESQALAAEFEGRDDAFEQFVEDEKAKVYFRAQKSGNNEWFTPPEFVERARKTMGCIDLDPASCAVAQKTVRANQWCGAEDDGLSIDWWGNVWLNPPYSQPLVGQFAAKLVSEVTEGGVTQAICLTHNHTDTEWFSLLAHASTGICFTRGRVRFLGSDGEPVNSPTQGQAFFYFGEHWSEFVEEFSGVGFFVVRP